MASVVLDEKAIFNVAREIASPDARAEYLRQACGTDTGLLERVQVLLRAYEGQASFLESPPVIGASQTTDQPLAETPGGVIGPYKLLEQIGEGGFGVVFMAEQTAPVRRKVALKILKPGMDTKQVVARFEAERQALAIMDHPNIAKVHDGGATPPSPPSQGGAWGGGRPYFVMELVKGVPITEFCDQNHLTPRQRLELFIPVCQAVQHAHQKGIIHRDLKPSNILVVMHDTTPVPKVIDFGIAKALGQELTDKTLFTGFAQMVGTPLYMSPEQAGQSGLDIDTRSDIYSLGVLLYELLTGTTPFHKERFKKAAYDEIRRIIREEDPPKPSTRLSDSTDSLPSISAQRQTEPAKLTKLVRGELDWIVMKALEKDRNRRYETANGFAQDIQRYLADEPVHAGPPSAGYQLRKFVRRNRGPVVTAALVLLALVGGIVGTSLGLVAAEQARKDESEQRGIAVAEAARATEEAHQAKLARERAEKQWLRAEGLLYASQIRLAQLAWESNNAALAHHYLGQCRPDFRGWEHDYLFALFSSQQRTFQGHSDVVRCVAVTPDGKHLVSGSDDHTVRIWNVATGEETTRLKGHTKAVRCLVLSSDGKRIVSGGQDGMIRIWDLAKGVEVRAIKADELAVQRVAISRDGKQIISSGRDVKVWDAHTGQPVRTLPQGSGMPLWLEDNRIVSPTREDATSFKVSLKVWDVVSGAEVCNLKGHTQMVHCIAPLPDGKRIVSGSSDQTVRIWDTTTGQEVRTLRGSSSPIYAVVASADGKRIIAGAGDGAVLVWDLTTGQQTGTLRGHTGAVWCLAVSPAGQVFSGSYDHTIKVRNPEGRPTWKLFGNATTNMVVSNDGRNIISGSYFYADNSPAVKVWDAATGKEILALKGHTQKIRSVAASADGRRILSGDQTGIIKLWDTDKKAEMLTLSAHVMDRGQSFALSPDGKWIVGFRQWVVKIWDAQTGQEIRSMEGHRGGVTGIAFLSGGRRIVTGNSDSTLKIWDAQTGQAVATLKGHTAEITCLALLPDGQRIVSGSSDKTAKIWSAVTGEVLATLTGHTGAITSVAVLGGKRIVTGSWDGTVRVWDAATGYETVTLKGPVSGVQSVATSPDGNRILVLWTNGQSAAWEARPSARPGATDTIARLQARDN